MLLAAAINVEGTYVSLFSDPVFRTKGDTTYKKNNGSQHLPKGGFNIAQFCCLCGIEYVVLLIKSLLLLVRHTKVDALEHNGVCISEIKCYHRIIFFATVCFLRFPKCSTLQVILTYFNQHFTTDSAIVGRCQAWEHVRLTYNMYFTHNMRKYWCPNCCLHPVPIPGKLWLSSFCWIVSWNLRHPVVSCGCGLWLVFDSRFLQHLGGEKTIG